MIVTVTANPSIDRTYAVGELQPGALHRARSYRCEASGKGVNVSRVLQQLGTPTLAVTTVGGSEATLFANLLGDLPVSSVSVGGPVRANVTVLGRRGEATKVNAPGTTLQSDESTRLLQAVSTATTEATWLACCGTLPGDTDPRLIRRLVQLGRDSGVNVAVDSSGAALEAAADAGADLLAPNSAELAELAGTAVDTVAQAATVSAEVHRRFGATVLVSLGADGAIVTTSDGCWHAAAAPITPVNPTGAGDALLAGYLYADGTPAPDRLAYAVSVGSAACLAAGTADLPDGPSNLTQVTTVPIAVASTPPPALRRKL